MITSTRSVSDLYKILSDLDMIVVNYNYDIYEIRKSIKIGKYGL